MQYHQIQNESRMIAKSQTLKKFREHNHWIQLIGNQQSIHKPHLIPQNKSYPSNTYHE